MKKSKTEKAKALLESLAGGEPGPLALKKETYREDLIRAFNWYNREKDRKDAKRYLLAYLKKNMPSEHKQFVDVHEREIPAAMGWVARLLTNEAQLGQNELTKFNEFIIGFGTRPRAEESQISVKKEKPAKPTKADLPKVDPLAEKIAEFLGEFEFALDEILQDGKTSVSAFSALQGVAFAKQAQPRLEAWAKQKMAEYLEVFKGQDKYIKEAYSNYTKARITVTLKYLKAILDDCAKFVEVKKAARKPRVTKPKAPGVQVKNMRYLTEHKELGLKSVMPTEIVGASQVWLFNTKTRKVTVLRADSGSFTVKGSTILGWDSILSQTKTLRKPEEIIPKILSLGKIPLRKLLDEVKTKPGPANGRVNADTIILRAIK